MESKHKIPKATVKRLPLYQRYFGMLHESGTLRISSSELSEVIKIDSATIRRDFSYFGELGKRGYGYDVESLLNFFNKTLNQDKLRQVALIGLGNLGYALLKYHFQKSNSVRISAVFDVDAELINTLQNGVPVYAIDALEEQIKLQHIDLVILSVPQKVAQEIVDRLVKVGIRGILNFTPIRLTVPDTVCVQNVDLTNELQSLIYFVDSQK